MINTELTSLATVVHFLDTWFWKCCSKAVCHFTSALSNKVTTSHQISLQSQFSAIFPYISHALFIIFTHFPGLWNLIPLPQTLKITLCYPRMNMPENEVFCVYRTTTYLEYIHKLIYTSPAYWVLIIFYITSFYGSHLTYAFQAYGVITDSFFAHYVPHQLTFDIFLLILNLLNLRLSSNF